VIRVLQVSKVRKVNLDQRAHLVLKAHVDNRGRLVVKDLLDHKVRLVFKDRPGPPVSLKS
jgi:hypothetical protein